MLDFTTSAVVTERDMDRTEDVIMQLEDSDWAASVHCAGSLSAGSSGSSRNPPSRSDAGQPIPIPMPGSSLSHLAPSRR